MSQSNGNKNIIMQVIDVEAHRDIRLSYNEASWVRKFIADITSSILVSILIALVLGYLVGFYLLPPYIDKYLVAPTYLNPGQVRTDIISKWSLYGAIITSALAFIITRVVYFYTRYK